MTKLFERMAADCYLVHIFGMTHGSKVKRDGFPYTRVKAGEVAVNVAIEGWHCIPTSEPVVPDVDLVDGADVAAKSVEVVLHVPASVLIHLTGIDGVLAPTRRLVQDACNSSD